MGGIGKRVKGMFFAKKDGLFFLFREKLKKIFQRMKKTMKIKLTNTFLFGIIS